MSGNDLKRCLYCWQLSGYAESGGLMHWDEYCEHLRAGYLKRPKRRRTKSKAPEKKEPEQKLF